MTAVGPLIAVGRTSDVYEFGRGSVIKVPRPHVPSHWADMEARFTAAVHEVGAPAPEVREVIQVEGRDAIVFERVRGQSMWELMVAAPEEGAMLGRELAGVHKQILSAGLPHEVVGLVERMSRKVADVEQLTSTERDEATQALQHMPRGAALLHGDLHPGNVLLSDGGPVVIDWFDAAIGHPAADVVRSSLLLRPFGSDDDRPHLPGAAPGLLLGAHDAYVGAMSDILGPPTERLKQLEAIVAASRLVENAEADESALLALWRGRAGPNQSSLLHALSVPGVNQTSE